jgi:hypothetical protein
MPQAGHHPAQTATTGISAQGGNNVWAHKAATRPGAKPYKVGTPFDRVQAVVADVAVWANGPDSPHAGNCTANSTSLRCMPASL